MSKRMVVGHQYAARGALWPVYVFSIAWLYLDRFDAAGWAYGVFWTLAVLTLIASIADFFVQEPREPMWQPPKKEGQ